MNAIKFYTTLIVLLIPVFVAGQGRATLRGTVTTTNKEAIEYASVYLKNTSYGTTTDLKGKFHIHVPPGTYTLVVSTLGYQTYEEKIDIRPGDPTHVHIRLKESNIGLGEVEIVGTSMVQQINKTAYNVVAVDATALHNTTLNLASALDRVSGVKIKEVGGVGSNTQITLNGFTGNHVRVFLDGVPLQGSGSSIGINNMPVNFAERIEVYKGVVPIELGSDALGGAINIVTKNSPNTFLDASYSYGSFNTHKSNLNLGHTTRSGMTFQLTAYQNYSDNNYKVKTNNLDLDTYKYSDEEYWFRRFHDTYHNEAVVAKVGVRNKPWATRLTFETTYSQEYAEIQNGNLMKVVFGGKERSSKSVIPAVNYELRNLLTDGLHLNLSARYNHTKSESLDTMARRYNWAGEYVTTNSKGEGQYTDSKTKNDNWYVTGNVNYRLGERHTFAVNHVFNTYSRKNDNINVTSEADLMKRSSTKNVLGGSYKFDYNGIWTASAFAKYYDIKVTGPIDVSTTTTSEYELQNRSYNTVGYGLASTYVILSPLRLKVSYERSYRLPSEMELFGDNVLETGDAGLKPESSNNINVNVTFDYRFNKNHAIYTDAGFVYRNTQDYIRRLVEQRYGGAYYTNHGKVVNKGFDFETRYYYKRSFNIGGNLTYQDIRNMERYGVRGQELVYYKDRMPNQPYLMSNVDASYTFFRLFGEKNALSVGYNMQYVNKFYLAWRSEGGDITVPEQLSHDLSLHYSLQNGRYNISLEARNVTNEMLYDNYSLQKPGRSFNVKFRYYFLKTR